MIFSYFQEGQVIELSQVSDIRPGNAPKVSTILFHLWNKASVYKLVEGTVI